MDTISVNEAIERLPELNGQSIALFGVLSLDFEGQCISHVPEFESRDVGHGSFQSSIWVEFDLEQLGQREEWLQQFDGRHVRVEGCISGPDPRLAGCGHLSMWPALIVVQSIEKWRLGSRDDG